MKRTFRQQKSAVGRGDGNRCFHQMVSRAACHDQRARTHHRADQQASAGHGEQEMPGQPGARWRPRYPGQCQYEQYGGNAVIEEALTLDQEVGKALDAKILEQRNHCYGIGRRYQYGKDERGGGRPAKQPAHAQIRDRGRNHHTDNAEQQNRSGIALQLTPAQFQGRLKQQRRQDHVENDVVSQCYPKIDMRNGQRHPRDHQADGVGQAQPASRDCHQDRDHQQADGFADNEVHEPVIGFRRRWEQENRWIRRLSTARCIRFLYFRRQIHVEFIWPSN